jgi:membrane protease YdiL (CAAX protease family)
LATIFAGEKSIVRSHVVGNVRAYTGCICNPADRGGKLEAGPMVEQFPKFILGLVASGSIFLFTDFLFALLVTRSGFGRWRWAALTQIVTMFPINLLGGPLGEEAGWRGFALTRIQRGLNPVLSAIVVGFFWANWHLPLILAHVFSVNWWQFLLMTVSASILISFGFNVSRGSTICAIFLHGIYNVAIGVIGNDFIGKAELRSQSFQTRALWMAYVGVAGLLCLVTKGRLGYRRSLPRLD